MNIDDMFKILEIQARMSHIIEGIDAVNPFLLDEEREHFQKSLTEAKKSVEERVSFDDIIEFLVKFEEELREVAVKYNNMPEEDLLDHLHKLHPDSDIKL